MVPGRLLRVAAPAGAAGVLVAGLAPWTVSGSAARNSFATVRTARLLEVGPSWAGAALATWYAVPVLVVVAVAAAVFGRTRVAGACASVVGAAELVLAVCVLVSPVEAGRGVHAGVAAAVVAVVAGAALLVLPDHHRHAGRTERSPRDQ